MKNRFSLMARTTLASLVISSMALTACQKVEAVPAQDSTATPTEQTQVNPPQTQSAKSEVKAVAKETGQKVEEAAKSVETEVKDASDKVMTEVKEAAQSVKDEFENKADTLPQGAYGTYEGTLPCADCSGIKTTLEINPEGTYTMTQVYEGSKEAMTDSEGGSFTTKGNVITLAEGKLLKVDDGTVRFLDDEGKEVEGSLSNYYILKKVK